MRTTVLIAITAMTSVVFGVSSANADDASGPRNISSCTIINKPGSYVLTNNIVATAKDLKSVGSPVFPACIVIVADAVSFDLKGFAISGPGSGFGIANEVADPSTRLPIGTRVSNGTVALFERGVSLGGYGHIAEHLRLIANGAGLTVGGNFSRVEDVDSLFNTNSGIICYQGSYSIARSNVSWNANIGIDLGQCSGGSLIGNIVTGNGQGNSAGVGAGIGIKAKCPSLLVQNMASGNFGGDIVTDLPAPACTLSDNNPAP